MSQYVNYYLKNIFVYELAHGVPLIITLREFIPKMGEFFYPNAKENRVDA